MHSATGRALDAVVVVRRVSQAGPKMPGGAPPGSGSRPGRPITGKIGSRRYTVDQRPVRAVKRVIDGDTIVLENNERIRLIGVDAPETSHPDQPPEFGGEWATKFTEHVLQNEEVVLGYNGDRHDAHGRTRAYVYVANTNRLLNLELIENGYARARAFHDHPKHAAFKAAERRAIAARRGIHGLAHVLQKPGSPQTTAIAARPPTEIQPSPPPAAGHHRHPSALTWALIGIAATAVAALLLKGNNDPPWPTRMPDSVSQWDDNGDGRIWCIEARRHGIAPVPKNHPAYPFMYDADADGVGLRSLAGPRSPLTFRPHRPPAQRSRATPRITVFATWRNSGFLNNDGR